MRISDWSSDVCSSDLTTGGLVLLSTADHAQALGVENVEAVRRGVANVARHVENTQKFGVPVAVALNSFVTDTEAEIAPVRAELATLGLASVFSHQCAEASAANLPPAHSVLELNETEPLNVQHLSLAHPRT